MDPWLIYLTLFAVGGISGALDVIGGGGSFLTLPLLIFLGQPAVIANGTNRVGIVLQSGGAVWGFHRHRVVDWRSLSWAALPATVGCIIGAYIALGMNDESFKKALAVLMVIMTGWILWDPIPRWQARSARAQLVPTWAVAGGFLFAGFFGGFIQAGVGFLLLAVTTLAGLDLVRGNGVKVLTVLCFATVGLVIFASEGKVDWPMGLALSAGRLLGGLWGVRLVMLKGHGWVKGVVTTAMIACALKLWFGS
ncbi:MAG: sulfite exporter TauE/SafE family protein [Nitrospirae bacterium]|nr:sulfite exporter TauE/SafE family protein [Nitrospirota bacterium]